MSAGGLRNYGRNVPRPSKASKVYVKLRRCTADQHQDKHRMKLFGLSVIIQISVSFIYAFSKCSSVVAFATILCPHVNCQVRF